MSIYIQYIHIYLNQVELCWLHKTSFPPFISLGSSFGLHVCPRPIDQYMFYFVFLGYDYHDLVPRGEHLLRVQIFHAKSVH